MKSIIIASIALTAWSASAMAHDKHQHHSDGLAQAVRNLTLQTSSVVQMAKLITAAETAGREKNVQAQMLAVLLRIEAALEDDKHKN
jgi:hypothetical protein